MEQVLREANLQTARERALHVAQRSMPGITALVARMPDGFAWAILMNSRPENWDRFNKELNRTFEQLALMGTPRPKS